MRAFFYMEVGDEALRKDTDLMAV